MSDKSSMSSGSSSMTDYYNDDYYQMTSDDEYLSELGSFWDTEQRNSLAVFGVNLATAARKDVQQIFVETPTNKPV